MNSVSKFRIIRFFSQTFTGVKHLMSKSYYLLA